VRTERENEGQGIEFDGDGRRVRKKKNATRERKSSSKCVLDSLKSYLIPDWSSDFADGRGSTRCGAARRPQGVLAGQRVPVCVPLCLDKSTSE
jgi:hypothetical protein